MTRTFSFFKGHGLGNDYIALTLDALPLELTPPVVRLLCDRHRGIGSDGILARVPSDRAEFGLRIFNPDGSEAEKSGNGLRIFASYLLHDGEVGIGRLFTVDTPGGVVTLAVVARNDDGLQVEVDMGPASFRSSAVGFSGPDRELAGEPLELAAGDRVSINTVSLGNPHCVIFQDELDPDDLRRRAPQICSHPWFERGTNVQFARAVAPGIVEAWVWERGAGETLASGSSACAVAAVAVRRGMAGGREVEVRMPGGSLDVVVREDWTVLQRGPAEAVFHGEASAELVHRMGALG
jgi:diaminopimelate epimerase